MPSPTAADELVVEERFAIVPEWLLDAEVSDCAVRLYAVLLRYGHSSGARMPSRATLAARLHKRSVDTVDRAMRELVELGAVAVQARYSGRERLTNAYHVRTSRPGVDVHPKPDLEAPVPFVPVEGGRTGAATPTPRGGRAGAAGRCVPARGGRTRAAEVAAPVRHDPESLTQSAPPPPPPVARQCGITDWDRFVAQVLAHRRTAGQPLGRWSAQCLDAALQLAVRGRGWPAAVAVHALLSVAADPATRSPMRVAEAGPWWDQPATTSGPTRTHNPEVEEAEAVLADIGGLRVALQQQARALLLTEGQPVTRSTVALRARDLLLAHSSAEPSDAR